MWHFQIDHHGLWDYDLPAHPVLGDISVNGRRIKAVIQLTKQGFTFAFDRRTGAPVWPIEERPVPQSTVPGERTSPTQPFPTKPPLFTLQRSTEENLLDFSPALRKQALENLQQFVHGPIYTPPSEQGTLFLPGVFGGANWGGGAFDPETGMLYVPSRMTPDLSRALFNSSRRARHKDAAVRQRTAAGVARTIYRTALEGMGRSYMISGKQYIAVATGGGETSEIVALALP
ncbi:MAG: hypothetical protein DMF90_26045 [Acidobacteria bacterium]|nr:MAG: hypothetical protein DMF90_26045 [Acidobacteriota bacterium]